MLKLYRNKLAEASSPYLLQHAHNPVDWYEWGPEALNKAKEEDKPLIISIGYSACHWCHVMERESFMDKEVAAYMNEHFVSIKVDREERPDLDQIYIEASQLMNGNAGWPLNAFALPNGRPFWVGVYFPKDKWLDVLKRMNEIYKNHRKTVEQQAENLTLGIRNEKMVGLKAEEDPDFKKSDYEGLWEHWKERIDNKNGGFSGAQKFPMVSGWEFLLQYQHLTQNKEVLEAVKTTLKAMAWGGIYDQVGGGFSRYATDSRWFAPHFEKMLYDNAQLISLYSQAYRETGEELYREVVKESLAFVKNELTSKEGGFYSSLNAESEDVEGKFYVWTSKEIEEHLDPEQAEIFKAYYNIIPNGNWMGIQNIPFRNRTVEELSELIDIVPSRIEFKMHAARKKLLQVRNRRERPSRDDKILTSWNALMIKAYIEAYRSLQEDKYLNAALMNAEFLLKNSRAEDGSLYRNFKDGKASIPGFLDDYAYLAEAFIYLYKATFDIKWLNEAKKLTTYVIAHFTNKDGDLFYYTSELSEKLIARKAQFIDNELPASNSVMAKVLFILGHYYEKEEWVNRSKKMLMAIKPILGKGAPYFGKWTQLMAMFAYTPFEVAIMGEEAVQKNAEIQKHYLPLSLFMGGMDENLPLLEGKKGAGTQIYICQNKTCKKPLTEVSEAMELLSW